MTAPSLFLVPATPLNSAPSSPSSPSGSSVAPTTQVIPRFPKGREKLPPTRSWSQASADRSANASARGKAASPTPSTNTNGNRNSSETAIFSIYSMYGDGKSPTATSPPVSPTVGTHSASVALGFQADRDDRTSWAMTDQNIDGGGGFGSVSGIGNGPHDLWTEASHQQQPRQDHRFQKNQQPRELGLAAAASPLKARPSVRFAPSPPSSPPPRPPPAHNPSPPPLPAEESSSKWDTNSSLRRQNTQSSRYTSQTESSISGIEFGGSDDEGYSSRAGFLHRKSSSRSSSVSLAESSELAYFNGDSMASIRPPQNSSGGPWAAIQAKVDGTSSGTIPSSTEPPSIANIAKTASNSDNPSPLLAMHGYPYGVDAADIPLNGTSKFANGFASNPASARLPPGLCDASVHNSRQPPPLDLHLKPSRSSLSHSRSSSTSSSSASNSAYVTPLTSVSTQPPQLLPNGPSQPPQVNGYRDSTESNDMNMNYHHPQHRYHSTASPSASVPSTPKKATPSQSPAPSPLRGSPAPVSTNHVGNGYQPPLPPSAYGSPHHSQQMQQRQSAGSSLSPSQRQSNASSASSSPPSRHDSQQQSQQYHQSTLAPNPRHQFHQPPTHSPHSSLSQGHNHSPHSSHSSSSGSALTPSTAPVTPTAMGASPAPVIGRYSPHQSITSGTRSIEKLPRFDKDLPPVVQGQPQTAPQSRPTSRHPSPSPSGQSGSLLAVGANGVSPLPPSPRKGSPNHSPNGSSSSAGAHAGIGLELRVTPSQASSATNESMMPSPNPNPILNSKLSNSNLSNSNTNKLKTHSTPSLVPSVGEDLDAFHVRSTYAQLEMSGVKGDGYEEGVERTRAARTKMPSPNASISSPDASPNTSGEGTGSSDVSTESTDSQQKKSRRTKSQILADEAIADENEKKRELDPKEIQILGSVDRYGFLTVPSHDRLILLPSQPLLKPLSASPASAPASPQPPATPAPQTLRALPPVVPRPKEMERIAKWNRMFVPHARDEGGNVQAWRIRPTKVAKLRRRVYKGIPDRWRAAAWEVLMAAYASGSGGGGAAGEATDASQQAASAGVASAGVEEVDQLAREYRDGLEKPSSYDIQIDLDVPRTISGHIMFRTRYGAGQRSLFHVLHSFSLRCSTCGYVQGMGPITATLLCYMAPSLAYASLVRLHNAYSMHAVFSPGFPGLLEAIYVQERIMQLFLPGVYDAFKKHMISTTSYATKWYITLFANSVPFQTQLRLWDVFLLEGYDVFIAVAMSIIWVYRDQIVSPQANFETVLSLLSSFFVPEDEDIFLSWIEKMLGDKKLRANMRQWRVEWQELVRTGKDGDALL